ncbi:MAG: hypothetical protein PVJ76_15560 [Gemmatimonadota bacterium]
MTDQEQTMGRNLEVSDEPAGDSVSLSRQSAVNAVFRGGTTAVLALGATYASVSFLPSPFSILVALGTTFVAGAGLVELGRAARHLLRFGSRLPALALLSAGGFGALALTWSVLMGMQSVGLLNVPMALRQLLGAASMGTGVLLVLSVLGIVLQWAFSPRLDADPEADGA